MALKEINTLPKTAGNLLVEGRATWNKILIDRIWKIMDNKNMLGQPYDHMINHNND